MAAGMGHCGLLEEMLIEQTTELLGVPPEGLLRPEASAERRVGDSGNTVGKAVYLLPALMKPKREF